MGPRELYEVIGSTQDRAIELARDGAPEGTRIVARSQTKGRGRLDHRWWSPPGAGVYLSLILDAPPPPRTLLALAIGVELADALARRYGIPTSVKWPNDLLVTGSSTPRKISGILIDEVRSVSGSIKEVAGIGVNVHPRPADAPPELRARVAAIGEWAQPIPELDDVEEWVVAAALRAAHLLHQPDGPSVIVRRCTGALYGRGHSARVDGIPSGRIEGIGSEGELWMRRGPDRIAIRAGDVEVESEP